MASETVGSNAAEMTVRFAENASAKKRAYCSAAIPPSVRSTGARICVRFMTASSHSISLHVGATAASAVTPACGGGLSRPAQIDAVPVRVEVAERGVRLFVLVAVPFERKARSPLEVV